MNKLIAMGRLVKDADVQTTSNGKKIAKFTLAVDRQFKREGQANADFIKMVAFGKTAEIIEKYLHKGSKILAEGELQNNNWEDKDGNKRYDMQVLVSRIEFAESRNASQQGNGNGNVQQVSPADDDFMNIDDGTDDGVPFA